MKWWIFTFRNKTIKRVEIRGFKFRFRKYWLDIHSASDNWRMRIRVDMHPYGFLYAAATQDNMKNLSGFCHSVYLTSMIMTQDQGFVDGLRKNLNKYFKHQEIAAKNAAEKVTDIQEKSDESLMRDAVKYAKMNKKERKKARAKMREIIKDEIKTVV